MCQNPCIGESTPLNVASDNSVSPNFRFNSNGSVFNFKILELFGSSLVCCQDIEDSEMGIAVEQIGGNPTLVKTSALQNKLIQVIIPTSNNPRIKIIKEGGKFFLIGIDDTRADYYFRFRLDGDDFGANIKFSSSKILVSG